MQTRNFRLLGASARDKVRAVAGAAVTAWAADWGLDDAACGVECDAAGAGGAGAPWRQGWRGAEAQLWLSWPASLQGALQQAMFGADAGPGTPQLAPQAAARGFDELLAALAAALLPGPHARRDGVPGAQQFAPGAGTLLLKVRVGGQVLHCLLDSAAVDKLAPPAKAAPAKPLAKVDYLHALRDSKVSLAVRAGQAELGLGALMSVAVGDVIALDCSLDAPVTVMGPNGAPILRAYLGQMQGSVAVEIESRY